MANYLRKLILIILAAAGVLLAGPLDKAYAHTLAKDGKISAFLHIAPDDKPQPGKVNIVHIYYNDQDFRFTTEGCDCKISVKEYNKTLYKGVLPAIGTRVGELKVLLPDNDSSYDVVVSGMPKTAGFFQPFKLNFDIDVGNPPPVVLKPKNHQFFIPVIGGVLLAGGLKYFRRPNKKTRIKQ